MAQDNNTSKREALALKISRLYDEFKPQEMDRAMAQYEKMLDKECKGVRTREAVDYVFLWMLKCENNFRLNVYHLNHRLLADAAALVDAFPDSLSEAQAASGRYETMDDIARWKYDSYHKIADGYNSDGRRADAAKYYAMANKYTGDGREEVFAPKSYLKHDPVEDTEEYLAIKDEMEEKLYNEFKGELRGMGFCFRYWSAKAAILLSDYGIEWRSPTLMNPGVMFD